MSEREVLFEMAVQDMILEVVDEAPLLTRSDVQGRAQVVAKGIIDKVRHHRTGDGVTVTLSQNDVDVILDRVNHWDIEEKLIQARDARQGRTEDDARR